MDMKKILPGVKNEMEKELETGEDVSRLSSYNVKIDVFEGPFDLLLHMIDDGRVDLYKVSLTNITQGYLDYIRTLDKYSIVVASEFLLMTAYLLEMKSRMLLPAKEEPKPEELDIGNVEEILAERLAEYKVFKDVAGELKKRKELFQNVYSRYTVQEAIASQEFYLTEVSLKDLVIAFKKVWDAANEKDETREIVAENISINDKIKEILDRVKGKKDGVKFEDFFADASKLAIVVMFLAMLELIRQKLIKIRQDALFGGIFIYGMGG